MLYANLFALGVICGVVFNLVTLIEKILKSKLLFYILDVITLSSFALAYFCTVFAYNGGELRFLYFLLLALGFTLYVKTFYKWSMPLINALSQKIHIPTLKFTKRLKFSKKSIKNLLHYNR